MRPRLLAVLLLLLGPGVDRTPCQDLPANELERARQLFGTAALEHARALVQARGLSPSRIKDVALEEICGSLACFERRGEVGVLFHDYDHDESLLRTWLIDRSGIPTFREAPLTRHRIAGLIEGLRRELGVEALQATRVPSRRGPLRDRQPPEHRRSAADLMTSFAALLQELQVLFPVPALRRAMLEARKTDADPAQWASFVLFGVPF